MIKIFVFFITFNFLLGCAATPNERTQYPAPHNDYSGRLVLKHFSDENQDEFMIRTCKYYGGVNQDTKTIIGEDFFLQEVIEFKCNYHGKLQDELNIDGKSSQRLSGLSAKNKCENLGFKVGTVDFRKCMEELTQ
ncbi:MAG: hypothetical protein P8K73_05495 [Methylophilaceae bacterium]|jgi:hypothetical protein|nr:hypothetical protein [Methylophilaceae bacterium]